MYASLLSIVAIHERLLIRTGYYIDHFFFIRVLLKCIKRRNILYNIVDVQKYYKIKTLIF